MAGVIIVLSQVAWFACVLGAANGNAWIGPAVVAATIGVAVVTLGRPRETLLLALVAGLIGLLVETVMIASGLVEYVLPGPWPMLPPAWLFGLWVVFSVLPNTALAWLHGRRAVQAGLGAVGAPLAYLGGAKLGAMRFEEPAVAGLTLLGALWAVAFPSLMAAARGLASPQTLRTASA